MRILIGMPEPGSHGGPAACEPPFISELRSSGVQVDEEIYAYAKSLTVTGRVRRVWRTAERFRERASSGQYDLIHLNTSFDTRALFRDVAVVRRLSRLPTKIFLKFHGSNARLLKTRNPLLAALRQHLLARIDAVGVLSSEERANFLDAGIPAARVFQIKNVVERTATAVDDGFAERLKVTKETPLLLFIGRFIPAKGLLDCIHACKLIADRNQDFLLLCLGSGPARREAEAAVAQLGLESKVRFFGYVPEEQTTGFYANSTMLLFPTYHYEGFPMVIFNAAAAGLPIITTCIRAAADFLKEPDHCLWVEPRRPDLLAEKISKLLQDGEQRQTMSRNNKLLAAQFSPEIVTHEYLEVYEAIISQQEGV
jgi:glycosyltransferase involved in cell wall biosynthesis